MAIPVPPRAMPVAPPVAGYAGGNPTVALRAMRSTPRVNAPPAPPRPVPTNINPVYGSLIDSARNYDNLYQDYVNSRKRMLQGGGTPSWSMTPSTVTGNLQDVIDAGNGRPPSVSTAPPSPIQNQLPVRQPLPPNAPGAGQAVSNSVESGMFQPTGVGTAVSSGLGSSMAQDYINSRGSQGAQPMTAAPSVQAMLPSLQAMTTSSSPAPVPTPTSAFASTAPSLYNAADPDRALRYMRGY